MYMFQSYCVSHPRIYMLAPGLSEPKTSPSFPEKRAHLLEYDLHIVRALLTGAGGRDLSGAELGFLPPEI